jgi:hypothetical protein
MKPNGWWLPRRSLRKHCTDAIAHGRDFVRQPDIDHPIRDRSDAPSIAAHRYRSPKTRFWRIRLRGADRRTQSDYAYARSARPNFSMSAFARVTDRLMAACIKTAYVLSL